MCFIHCKVFLGTLSHFILIKSFYIVRMGFYFIPISQVEKVTWFRVVAWIGFREASPSMMVFVPCMVLVKTCFHLEPCLVSQELGVRWSRYFLHFLDEEAETLRGGVIFSSSLDYAQPSSPRPLLSHLDPYRLWWFSNTGGKSHFLKEEK